LSTAKRTLILAFTLLLICSFTGCAQTITIPDGNITGDIAYFSAMDTDTLKKTCEGQTIEVTGTVTSEGLSYIRVGDPLRSEVTFNCYPADADAASTFSKGEQVTVYGKCTSVLFSTVTLKECRIVGSNTPATAATENTETTESTENTETTEDATHVHAWKDATCTEPKICTVCGERSGSAAGHSYQNGKCAVCGQSDPSDPATTMVWIPKSGKKYHSKATCSNMSDPKQVTQEYAEQQGYTPCQKCH